MMGIEAARRSNYYQSKSVVVGIQRIYKRISKKYSPSWLLQELDELNHTAQCVQAEFERQMGKESK